eukprot:5560951-Pleurochrysis_carterae.AAC.4
MANCMGAYLTRQKLYPSIGIVYLLKLMGDIGMLAMPMGNYIPNVYIGDSAVKSYFEPRPHSLSAHSGQ